MVQWDYPHHIRSSSSLNTGGRKRKKSSFSHQGDLGGQSFIKTLGGTRRQDILENLLITGGHVKEDQQCTKTALFTEYPERIWDQRPYSYGGYSPLGELCLATKSRDSRLYEEHNFDVCQERMESFKTEDKVYTWRAHHWACGWVDFLMISPKACSQAQTKACELLDELNRETILDECLYFEKRSELSNEWWDDLTDEQKDWELRQVSCMTDTVEERIRLVKDQYESDL